MRELFEGGQTDDPVEAARRGVRPVRRRRTYKTVTIAAGESGESAYAVHLDGKPVRTPAGRLLAVPTPELAGALAEEWAAQGEYIEPARMPLTRLANTIIDGVAAARGQVAAEIRKYLASDLVFYRAETPAPLRVIRTILEQILGEAAPDARAIEWDGENKPDTGRLSLPLIGAHEHAGDE